MVDDDDDDDDVDVQQRLYCRYHLGTEPNRWDYEQTSHMAKGQALLRRTTNDPNLGELYSAPRIWPCTHCLKASNIHLHPSRMPCLLFDSSSICGYPQPPIHPACGLSKIAPAIANGGNHNAASIRTSCLTLSTYLADRLMPVFTFKLAGSL